MRPRRRRTSSAIEPHLLEVGQRAVLADAIGAEAEAFVCFYASYDRKAFSPQLQDPTTGPGALRFRDRFTSVECTPAGPRC